MSLSYDPRDWYWKIGGSTTQVFSSKRGILVPTSDASYVSWGSAGGIATKIDTAANLGAVLAPYMLRPTDASVLSGYQDTQANDIASKAIFQVLFNHENRIRALEGKVALTVPQAIAAVKALM